MAVRLLFVLLFINFIGFSGNPLTKKISVNFKNIKIETALDELQTLGNIYFSYNSKVINTEKIITYNSENKNISIILTGILGKGFEYKHRGKYIIIQKEKPVLIKKKKIVLKGKVSNLKDSTHIAGVTIYEIDKLKTTSTNNTGDFNLNISTEKEDVMFLVSKENYRDTLLTSIDFKDTNLTIYLEPKTDTTTKVEFLKMDSIPWLKIFYTDQILNTIKNVELTENRKFQFSIIPFVGTNGKLSGKITNNLSVNLISGYALGVNGVEVGGVLNLIKDSMKGVQIAGVGNVVGGKVNGTQIAGTINFCYDSIIGLQASGFTNISTNNIHGTQIAGAFNYASSVNNGGQVAGTLNISKELKDGFQIGGNVNISKNISNGFQIGGALNISNYISNGFQIAGAVNINQQEIKGFQIAGLFNYTKTLSGFQLAPFNFSDTVNRGIPFGVLSFVKNGFHKFDLSFSDNLTSEFSFRTGVHKFYNILSVEHYLNETKTHVSFGYGIGTQVNFNKTIFSNLELSAKKIIPIDNIANTFDESNILGKLNLNLGFNIGNKVSILGGPELNLLIYDQNSTLLDNNIFSKQRSLFKERQQSTYLDLSIGYKIALRF